MRKQCREIVLAYILASLALAGCGRGSSLPALDRPGAPAPSASTNPAAINSYPVSFKEFSIPPGQSTTQWITVGSDGAIWFLTSAGVDMINGTGTVHSYSMPPLTEYAYIAGTRSRNVFFVGFCPLGRPDFGSFQAVFNIATSGVISGSTSQCGAMEVSEASISALTTAPGGDGVVEAVNEQGQYGIIGGENFSGSFRFSARLSDALVVTLTAGPENSIYAAAVNTGGRALIAQVRPNTELFAEPNEFLLPISGFESISGMTAGSDGNLWLAEPGRNVIARVSPKGAGYTEFPVPTPNAGVNQIVAAPDGALYFTESAAGKIGRITTNGQMMEFATPSRGPMGITACPTLCEDAHVRLFVTEAGSKVLRFQY